jgi:hypothetical protein
MVSSLGVEKKHHRVSFKKNSRRCDVGYVAGSFSQTREIEDWLRPYSGDGGKVLLREVESCAFCARRFLSLYPLRMCEDHIGLDEA